MHLGEGCPPGPSSPRSVADAVADAHQQREQLGRRRPPRNIATLLREREILHGRRAANVRHEMLQWSTACWMRGPTHKSDYCNIAQAKSTIALAFSPDGELFASTHGDHTVKVFVCATWKQLCVLSGHERTPWTVKFHPSDTRILASGSLDQTVRVWDITTRQTIRRHQFHFVVSCISFHSSGKFLAVTASKRISLWEWEGRDDAMDADDAPAAPPVRVLLEGEQPQRCAVDVWPLPSLPRLPRLLPLLLLLSAIELARRSTPRVAPQVRRIQIVARARASIRRRDQRRGAAEAAGAPHADGAAAGAERDNRECCS